MSNSTITDSLPQESLVRGTPWEEFLNNTIGYFFEILEEEVEYSIVHPFKAAISIVNKQNIFFIIPHPIIIITNSKNNKKKTTN